MSDLIIFIIGGLWIWFGIWYVDKWVIAHLKKNDKMDKTGELLVGIIGTFLGFISPAVLWIVDRKN